MTRAFMILFALFVGAACGSSDRSEPASSPGRCDTCGMRVTPDDGWRAGAEGLTFDSPKCLFRHASRHGTLTEPWVIEYYAQERRDATELLYVTGTDLRSPMGADLVPVDGREAAERMRTDHEGELILAFDEIEPALIESLFR